MSKSKDYKRYSCLDDLLDHTALDGLCAEMNCSTCGASELRQRVADFLAQRIGGATWKVSGNTGNHRLSTPQVETLAKELRTVTDGASLASHPDLLPARERAINFLIREVWNNGPKENREEWVRVSLGNTKAGQHYERLLAHYKEDLRRWAAERERNSPEVKQKRLEEEARLRRERIHQRSLRKAEIDRVWREK